MTTRSRRIATLLVVALLALSIVPGAVAAESRAGGTVIVEAGETTGDLQAVGGSVLVRGTVDGNLSAFAGNVRIVGTVTGAVRGASGNIEVTGTIEGDLEAGGGHVQIDEDGTVGGDVRAGAASVDIAGTVAGDVRVGAESIRLSPTARVGGTLEYDGRLDRQAGAEVVGSVAENPDLSVGGPVPQVADVVFSVYFVLVNLVVGAILLLVFPRFSRGLVDRTVERPGVTGVVGLGTLVATPVALVLVAITIIGIPVALTGFVGYGLAIWLGAIYGRYLVGAWLCSLADLDNRWLALLVGVFVVAAAVRVPAVGGLADLAALVWGLGALALGLYTGYRNRRKRDGTSPAPGATADGEGDEPAPA